MKKLFAAATYFVMIFFSALLQGCSFEDQGGIGPYRVSLAPNGVYAIINEKDSLGTFLLEGNIRRWGKHEKMLYGYQEAYAYPDGISTINGYFILDTRDGVSTQGLSKDELIHLLSTSTVQSITELQMDETPF